MSSVSYEDRAIISDFAESIVLEVAPEESDLFDELAQQYYIDPAPPDIAAEGSDDPLGFGLDSTIVAVTPAAMAMVTSVFGFILNAAAKEFKDEGAEYAKKKVKEFFEERSKKKKGKEKPRDQKQEQKKADASPGAEPAPGGDAADVTPPEAEVSSLAPLNTDQLRQMHEMAVEEAKRFGVSDIEAQAMADALLRRFVLS